jgi:iron complex outermembrane receptor protein
VRYDRASKHDVQTRRGGAKVDVDLGGVTLRSITGYTSLDNDLLEELDGTEFDYLWDTVADTSRVFSQEVQLVSDDSGPLNWVLGGYYLHEHATQDFPIFMPLLSGQLTWQSSIKTDAYAAFGQATYKLGKLELTGGLRYSRERKRAEFLQTLEDNAGLLTGAVGTYLTPAAPSDTYSSLTPRFAARFAFTPDASVYASATRGFKSGGFNLQNTGEKFDPETIWSYEAGLKSAWLDRRLTANMAAFVYDYKDLQVNQWAGLAALITNAANARIKGMELELTVRPMHGLTLDGSLALLDAKFRDYVTSNPNQPGAPEVNLTGFQMPRSPKSTINAGAEYVFNAPGMGDFILRGEMQRQDDIYFDQFETPSLRQPHYTLVNARLSFESEDGRWRAALFGRNLTNELYRTSVIRADSFFGTLDIYGLPRTYGVEVGMNFGGL